MKTKDRVCRKWLKKLLLLSMVLIFSSANVMAQGRLLNKVVSLPAKNTSIKNVLALISERGGFTFTFSDELPLDRTIKLEAKKQTVKSFLDELFPSGKFKYVERGNKILIIPKEETDYILPTQTIKGRVVDFDSKHALEGVNIVLNIGNQIFGTTTDALGYYKFNKVSLGRADVWYSYVGYETRIMSNVLIGSAKELVLDVGLSGLSVELSEVKVSNSPIHKSQPINDLAMVSARKISSLEMDNFAGAIADISRAAYSFPGVVVSNDGQNHLIIRGNSPKGVLWRLEGIEIPNLNHFAEIGASGGGIGIISNTMIANSDFFTSAFPAEYGNALSGVFDLRMRKGNTEKHEQTFQLGVLGLEFMAEGPIGKSKKSSYIAQYRYSTLQLAKTLGFEIDAVPRFQDLSFKFHLPTKKMGVFSIFGIAGISNEKDHDYNWKSNMATVGIANNLSLGSKTFIKTVAAFTGWKYQYDSYSIFHSGTQNQYNQHGDFSVNDRIAKLSFTINHKLSSSHKLKAGFVLENNFYKTDLSWFSDSLYNRAVNINHPLYDPSLEYEHTYAKSEGNTGTLQLFLNWNVQLAKSFSINTGFHLLQFFLNNKYSFEPRFSFNWAIDKKNSFSGGFGIHSRKESISLYMGQQLNENDRLIRPNKNLELTKARHYVLSYTHAFNMDLILKLEAYYQDLYDIPTSPFGTHYFSTINFDYGFEGSTLVSEGEAYNKGIELSIEKHFSKDYYFLINATIYKSKFKNFIGEEYYTKYDRNYAFSITATKEFKIGVDGQNVFGINSRVITTGGLRYLPTDLEASINSGRQQFIYDHGYTEQTDPYFTIDLQFFLKFNKKKYSSEWRLDLINLTNRKNVLEYDFDPTLGALVAEYQNPLIPVLSYRVHF